MPTYEYTCEKCRRAFHVTMTIGAHDKKRPECPKCGSRKVRQQLAAFFAVTSKKS